MADLSSVEIPIPLNWQDFQRACVPLFRNVLRDPHAQEWGREGQDQHGIDVFGFRDADAGKPVGVQCKRIEDPITEAMLRKEIGMDLPRFSGEPFAPSGRWPGTMPRTLPG